MSYWATQRIVGFFKRFNAGIPLAAVPLHDNLTKAANILEDIEGIGGVTILKPLAGNGKGWKIGYSPSVAATGGNVGTWNASYADGNVTLSNCYALLGGVVQTVTGNKTVGISTGYTYIGVQLDMESNTMTAISGSSMNDVSEITTPADDSQTTFKRPLYYVYLSAEDLFEIRIDFRNIPNFVSWL